MTLPTVLREGFRVFFLAAGLYAVTAIALWLIWLGVHASGGYVTGLTIAVAPHLWHAHEMIYGYALAVLGGFVLTAVPNWTGTPPPRPRTIALLAGLWLAGRLAVTLSALLAPWMVTADLLFLPALIALMAVRLAARPRPANVMILVVLVLLLAGNVLVHADWLGFAAGDEGRGERTGLLTLAALIAIIGGRVTPAFTRNAMQRAGRGEGWPATPPWLAAPSIAAAVAVPVAVVADAGESALALAAGLAGAGQLTRLALWRGRWTLRQPILWSMHLGALMLGLGYLALAAAAVGCGSEVAALHIVGIGAVGTMTLAVMSRAALGHSGRPLVVHRAMGVAYALVAGAALVRAAGSAGGIGLYYPAILASGAMWCAAFAIFVGCYWRLLTEPAGPSLGPTLMERRAAS